MQRITQVRESDRPVAGSSARRPEPGKDAPLMSGLLEGKVALGTGADAMVARGVQKFGRLE